MSVSRQHQVCGKRLQGALLVSVAVLCLLGVRLWYLQVLNGANFRNLSENNRTRAVRTAPPRGMFFDAEDRIIVTNRAAFDVALMLEDVPDVEQTIALLSEITGRDAENLKARMSGSRRSFPFEPRVLMSDVTLEELAKVKVNTYRLPGVVVRVTPRRSYPYQSMAAQLFGYAREISREQLESGRYVGYRPGDMVGQSGVERSYEKAIQGKSGYVRLEVDARGNRRGELGIVEAQAGSDIYLTLDLDLQLAAERALGERRGAVVAVNPKNGDILAMASSPSFDVNILSGDLRADEWTAIAGNPEHPLSNRAIASAYPPGSTFKLFMGVAGLAEKKISASTTVNCPGFYYFGGRRYRCHKPEGHGAVDLKKAIRVSCNVFFYHLGNLLGVEAIHDYATRFGLGNPTGVDLVGERGGVIPSNKWKLQHIGERWYPGETLSVAVGQGFVSATPIQMALATAALVNGGKVYKPRFIRKVHLSGEEGAPSELPIAPPSEVGVSQEILALVQEAAVSVVNEAGGTGSRTKLDGVLVGGKTGTAQVAALGTGSKSELLKDHAWFIAFGPAEDPTIAMAVIVENSGEGGGVAAAPVAKQVFEAHFRKRGLLPEANTEQVEGSLGNGLHSAD